MRFRIKRKYFCERAHASRTEVKCPLSEPGSVTSWLMRVDGVDRDDAATLLWNRFAFRLVRVARRQLRNIDQRMYDEEDLALSTLHEFLQRHLGGQYKRLSSRQDLWRLLVTISLNKSRNQRRFLSRLCRSGRVSRVGADFDSPEWIVTMADQCNYLMGLLDKRDQSGRLRQMAVMRLEGWSVSRMAEEIGCTRRTVGIRLELIQAIWRCHLDQQV